jgi:hypothetical protein
MHGIIYQVQAWRNNDELSETVIKYRLDVSVYTPSKSTIETSHFYFNEKKKLKQQCTVNCLNTKDDLQILLRFLSYLIYNVVLT